MRLPGYKKIVSAMEIPEDLSSNAAVVEMTGQNSINIGNYLGIIEYSETRLLVQCKHCRLEVIGRNLYIESYAKDEMHLKGYIEQVHYI